MLDGRVWEYNPLTLVDHVKELFMEEVQMFVAGFVRAPTEGALNLMMSPGRCGELDRRAAMLVEVQQAAGRVEHIG
jgi:hypothetical protein